MGALKTGACAKIVALVTVGAQKRNHLQSTDQGQRDKCCETLTEDCRRLQIRRERTLSQHTSYIKSSSTSVGVIIPHAL